jgi:peroxiredoxin
MSNGLTGDYDAVVEISVATVNRLVATVHQKVALDPEASPKLLHSFVARVGDTPKFAQYELAETFLREYFGANVLNHSDLWQDALPTLEEHVRNAQESLRQIGRDLSEIDGLPAPSGGFSEAFEQVAKLVAVRGTARIQVGTPTISLSHGSTSEVTIHFQVRAHYTPDPHTLPLPKPIHGEVKAAFTVEYNASGSAGKPALEVEPTEDDNKITFVSAPGTSLTGGEIKQIAREIRRFLRTKFEHIIAELPEEFPFQKFKSLVAGSTQVIALPLKLSALHIPAPTLDSVANLFLQSGHDFALAISKDFVNQKLRDSLKQIEDFSTPEYKLKAFGTTVGAFKAWVSSAEVKWNPDELVLIITGGAKKWGWAVVDEEYDVTIQQKFTLKLDAGEVSLQLLGGLSISITPELPQYLQWLKGQALSAIGPLRDTARADAEEKIKQELEERINKFDTALNSFASASATYTALEIGPDGVILRGTVTTSQSPPVVVDFIEIAGGTALSALRSWIPAGTIAKHVWFWITTDPKKPPWDGTLHEMRMSHTFILPLFSTLGTGRPRRIAQQVCLRVEGVRFGIEVSSDPHEQTCKLRGPPLPNMPAWWVRLMLPIWGPVGPDEILSDAIVAHINARSESVLPDDTATTSIIHFASDPSVPPLRMLSEALLGSRLREAEVPVIVVLPQRSFDRTRASVERTLGTFAAQLGGPLVITEDYEGSWTEAFEAAAKPATYLMSAGEVAWQHPGPLEARALTAALDRHGSAGRHYPSRFLQLGVRTGEPAPDVVFRDGEVQEKALQDQRGDGLLLRRLRGQRVLLVFWKSWSAPCLAELRRLQRMQDGSRAQGPVILAVGDGEEAERVKEIAREKDLRLTLVPDPMSQLAKRFRIACWPTTVRIDERGLVEGVYFGATLSRSEVGPSGATLR